MTFKCKMCGGEVEQIEGTNTGKCLYCKSLMTLPNSDNEKIINLYNRANDLRLYNEFDKSKEIYNEILKIDNDQVEAHWGILLCKYGVEYVDDARTKKKVATCHRTIDKSILSDIEYKYIIKNSYGETLELYQKEAEYIDKVQKRILEISKKEEPYDIFICYKETDENGDRTQDSVIAQDIYNELIKEGYKVFFSRITLEDKLGAEYEPYIYSALRSSKLMLVIGTSKENLESVWVKNEWNRYLEFMEEEKNKVMIPVYSKIDAYKLPNEFVKLQAQNMDKIGAMQDLIRGIKKIINTDQLDNKNNLKYQEVLDGVTNLGNGRYEVTECKEKLEASYIAFNLIILVLFGIFKLIALLGGCGYFLNVTILSDFFKLNWIPLFEMSMPLTCLQLLICLAVIFINLFKLLKRNIYQKTNCFNLLVVFLEFIFALLCVQHFFIVNIYYLISVILVLVLYFVNPKWHLDTSSKQIVDEDTKNKILAKNKTIKVNFISKSPYLIKTKYVIIFIISVIIIYIGYGLFVFITPNGNSLDSAKVQLKVTSIEYLYGSKEISNYSIVGIAKKNDIYTVLSLDTSDTPSNSCSIWYKVKNRYGVSGFICGNNANVQLLNADNGKDISVNQIKIKNDFIRIRKDPNINSQILGVVLKDEYYNIIDQKKDYNNIWYKIKNKFGITGYVSAGKNGEYVEIMYAK